MYVCPYFAIVLFSGCRGMQILSPAWSKVRDVVEGSVRTERSISRKQNCSAHNLYWPSIPKPSLCRLSFSMNYAFSSFLGRSSVLPGHQLLFRAQYVVCLLCPIQFKNFSCIFIYLFFSPITLLIPPRPQRIARSRQ